MSLSGTCGERQSKTNRDEGSDRLNDSTHRPACVWCGGGWTHISVQSEVPVSGVLSGDDTVPPVHSCDHCSLKLLRRYDFHGHDWLQDGDFGLFHS